MSEKCIRFSYKTDAGFVTEYSVKMNPKWQSRFLALAQHVAGWSRDPSSQVGAVIVRPDKSIASVGFNGFARGVEDFPGRLHNRDQKLLFTLHAELNAILAAKTPLDGCSLFVWPFQPCAQCAAAIIQAGIINVFCPPSSPGRWASSFQAARTMFHESGVVVHCIG